MIAEKEQTRQLLQPEQILLLVNDGVQKRDRRIAEQLSQKLHRPLESAQEYTKEFPESGLVISFGGDGTHQRIAKKMYQMKFPPAHILARGGSNDGTYTSLMREKASISEDEIVAGDISSLRENHPGVATIEGVDQDYVFLHAATNSSFGERQWKWTEIFRYIVLRKLQSHVGTVIAYLATLCDGQTHQNLDLYFTGQTFGKWNIDPTHSFFDNRLRKVSIEMNHFFERLILLYLYLLIDPRHEKSVPKGLAKIELAEKFSTVIAGENNLFLDGELGIVAPHLFTSKNGKKREHKLTYSRAQKSILTGALVASKKV